MTQKESFFSTFKNTFQKNVKETFSSVGECVNVCVNQTKEMIADVSSNPKDFDNLDPYKENGGREKSKSDLLSKDDLKLNNFSKNQSQGLAGKAIKTSAYAVCVVGGAAGAAAAGMVGVAAAAAAGVKAAMDNKKENTDSNQQSDLKETKKSQMTFW